jgi:hypothetical protein
VKSIMKKAFGLYKQSKKNLETDNPDLADQVIVALWESARDMTQEIEALKKELNEANLAKAEYYRHNDILTSQVEVLKHGKVRTPEGVV